MDENRIKKALKLLQEALVILDSVAVAEPTSDALAIEMACEDLAQAIGAVGELIGLPAEEAMGEAYVETPIQR
jgi:hypothetical protein